MQDERPVGKHMTYSAANSKMYCQHCNQHRMLKMPMSLADFSDELRSFVEFHNSCVGREGGEG
jgi:hypothetical protein